MQDSSVVDITAVHMINSHVFVSLYFRVLVNYGRVAGLLIVSVQPCPAGCSVIILRLLSFGRAKILMFVIA